MINVLYDKNDSRFHTAQWLFERTYHRTNRRWNLVVKPLLEFESRDPTI